MFNEGINFKEQYPNVKIKERFDIQDQFTTRLEVFVPDGVVIADEQKFSSDACFHYSYFGGRFVSKVKVEGGTLYQVDAWKD